MVDDLPGRAVEAKDEALMRHVYKLAEQSGWHYVEGVGIHVAHNAKSLRSPQPRYSLRDYPYRSSYASWRTKTGEVVWRVLEEKIDLKDLNNQQEQLAHRCRHRTVPVHIEMSFRDSPPATQLFYAQRVDQWRGGETPLTDFHQVWEQLRNDRRVGPHFEQQKVKYRRNMDDCSSTSQFDPLVQKCWQMMFKDEKDAKENCLEEGFHCSWDTSTNRLTLLNEQPFVRPHPITGQPIWYNHINVLHGQMMPGDYARTARLWDGPWSLWPTALSLYYRLLFNIYGLFVPEAEMGSTATKGSGEAFTTEELQ
ncbi:Dapdiamide synthesis protein DdaC, partial [Durusdinium trenchii]